MVKVDLITGFLGSGKTTFIRQYVSYLLKENIKICVLENDYGAINVDSMLLDDLKGPNLSVEMIAGGCDYDCHIRRFKTKLITLSLLGFQRVIVEPSGVFDVDEFYDILHDEQLSDRFEINNVIAIVNPMDCFDLSLESQYMLASQVATCGLIVLSRVQLATAGQIEKTVEIINESLKKIQCPRSFSIGENILSKDYKDFDDKDYQKINQCSYKDSRYIKLFSMNENSYQSLFFMKLKCDGQQLKENVQKLWNNENCGNILRIKGFIFEDDHWLEINATRNNIQSSISETGQSIIIVIGENLNAEVISSFIPAEYSSYQVVKDCQSAQKIAG